jgi:hypothetical protein
MSTSEIACTLSLSSSLLFNHAKLTFPTLLLPRPSISHLCVYLHRLAAAYAAATVASCTIAVGLSQLVPRLRVSPSAKALLGKLIPFASVASAGVVNIGLMRWKEMRDGMSAVLPSLPHLVSSFLPHQVGCTRFDDGDVRTEYGWSLTCASLLFPIGIAVYAPSDPVTNRPSHEKLGDSSIAGTYAVGQTAASRVLTNMCVFALFSPSFFKLD